MKYLLIYFFVLSTTTLGLSGSNISRRRLFLCCGGLLQVYTQPGNEADGACLPGDLAPSCIGFYKVPIDYSVRSFVGSEEAIKIYAPDLNYVPPIKSPRSYEDAVAVLLAQRRAADDISTVLLAGRLEEAGIKVLNLMPKLTSAGLVVVSFVKTNEPSGIVGELKRARIQTQFQDLQAIWGGVDVMIGQGLRGQLGVTAAAQIQILREVQEGVRAYDDFLAMVGL